MLLPSVLWFTVLADVPDPPMQVAVDPATSEPSRSDERRWVGTVGLDFWRTLLVTAGVARVRVRPAGHHAFASWVWAHAGIDPIHPQGTAGIGALAAGGASALGFGGSAHVYFVPDRIDVRVRPEVGVGLFDVATFMYGYNLSVGAPSQRMPHVPAHVVSVRFAFPPRGR